MPGIQLDPQYKWGFFERQIIFWKNECRGSLMKQFSD